MAGSSSDSMSDSEASDMNSSRASSEASDSPRPLGGGAPPLSRRVPLLSLRANLAALPRGDADMPGTARQETALASARHHPAAPAPDPQQAAQPPRLPRLALPASPPPPPAAEPQPSSREAALLSLDILSPAFGLQQEPGAGGQQLARSCAGRLGVPADRLKFYALVEVAGPGALPPGCTRAAVEVAGSRFSLAALEELVAENQRLAAGGQQQQQGGAEAAEAQAGVQRLQDERDGLRRELELSEQLRRKAANALRELQQEFTALSQELMHGSALARKQAPPLQLEGCDREASVGTPVALADGLLQGGGRDS